MLSSDLEFRTGTSPCSSRFHSGQEGLPRIDLRFESFNTFNHTNPQGVNLNNHDANFGKITSDYGPRTLQLGGKFVF